MIYNDKDIILKENDIAVTWSTVSLHILYFSTFSFGSVHGPHARNNDGKRSGQHKFWHGSVHRNHTLCSFFVCFRWSIIVIIYSLLPGTLFSYLCQTTIYIYYWSQSLKMLSCMWNQGKCNDMCYDAIPKGQRSSCTVDGEIHTKHAKSLKAWA